jgi:hypothetical protein
MWSIVGNVPDKDKITPEKTFLINSETGEARIIDWRKIQGLNPATTDNVVHLVS